MSEQWGAYQLKNNQLIYYLLKHWFDDDFILYGLRFEVFFCPTLPEDSDIVTFLRGLGIDWPTAPAEWTNEEREEKLLKVLENSPYRERETERGRRTSGGGGRKAEGEGEKEEREGVLRINLKRVFQEKGLLGYDPTLGTCTGEHTMGTFTRF